MQENTVFVFPGQGAQYVGMCKDIFHQFAVVRRLNIGVPAHCDLMVKAGVMLREKLEHINMSALKATWF